MHVEVEFAISLPGAWKGLIGRHDDADLNDNGRFLL